MIAYPPELLLNREEKRFLKEGFSVIG